MFLKSILIYIYMSLLRAFALFFSSSHSPVISFPNFLCYSYIILKKIKPHIFTGGLGAEPPSYLIVSCQNRKVLVGWRYDFWNIVDTISELAKTEQGETEVFRNRTDNVRQPYIVRQV